MNVTRIEPGPRMSRAVVHGDTAYLSGQVGKGSSVTEQARHIFTQIDAALRAAGTNKSNLLLAHVWLTNIETFDEMNAAWEAWIDPAAPPARATVEARLAGPEYLIEIAVVAARPPN
jgi:enamine deaminase RidA (YjgF/YER057c/UK114 family)